MHATCAKRGKRVRARHDWFWFSLVDFVNQSHSAVKQNQSKREITFNTRLKTALTSDLPRESKL